jgi:hypothetical protein
MDPATIALLAGALLLMSSKGQGTYGAGSTKYTLTPGTYRLKFKSTKPQTDSLQVLWAMPQLLMGGTGLQSQFKGFRVDDIDPNYWWIEAQSSYAGATQTIDLFPDMTLEKLS